MDQVKLCTEVNDLFPTLNGIYILFIFLSLTFNFFLLIVRSFFQKKYCIRSFVNGDNNENSNFFKKALIRWLKKE